MHYVTPYLDNNLRMLPRSLFYSDVAKATGYKIVISLPGEWSCTLVSGYTYNIYTRLLRVHLSILVAKFMKPVIAISSDSAQCWHKAN